MTAEPAKKVFDLVYMGTPAFAATILAALIAAGDRGRNPRRCNCWPRNTGEGCGR